MSFDLKSHKIMMQQLKGSVKQLEKSKKIVASALDDMIAQLPDDKKKQAIRLFKNAQKGQYVNPNEMMAFAGKMSATDEKQVKDAVDRVNDKRDEVTSK